MNKNEKANLVASVKDKLISNAFIAIIHYRGMNDKQLYDFRVALKSKGCGMKIVKNTLVKVAIEGTELEVLKSHLTGPTALLYSQDPVALAKAITDCGRDVESLKIITGFFKKSLLNETAIKEMAKLGSLEEVRASFVGLLKGAQTNFVRILSAPQKGLATLKTQ
jgi:large subunit ribosomal protein L10